jgi:hypothetical protein
MQINRRRKGSAVMAKYEARPETTESYACVVDQDDSVLVVYPHVGENENATKYAAWLNASELPDTGGLSDEEIAAMLDACRDADHFPTPTAKHLARCVVKLVAEVERLKARTSPAPEPTEPAAVDWTKPIQQRKGTPARFLGTLASGSYWTRVVAIGGPGKEHAQSVSEAGCFNASGVESSWDIINVPPPEPETRKEPETCIVWANVYNEP